MDKSTRSTNLPGNMHSIPRRDGTQTLTGISTTTGVARQIEENSERFGNRQMTVPATSLNDITSGMGFIRSQDRRDTNSVNPIIAPSGSSSNNRRTTTSSCNVTPNRRTSNSAGSRSGAPENGNLPRPPRVNAPLQPPNSPYITMIPPFGPFRPCHHSDTYYPRYQGHVSHNLPNPQPIFPSPFGGRIPCAPIPMPHGPIPIAPRGASVQPQMVVIPGTLTIGSCQHMLRPRVQCVATINIQLYVVRHPF